MATIKNDNTSVGKHAEKSVLLCIAGGNVKLCVHYENSVKVSQKIKNKYRMIQQSYLWVYIQKNWKQDLKRYLSTHVHSNIIHKSQEMEATLMYINGWINKQNAVYI